MDIDKSLDDLMAAKRKPSEPRKPRVSRNRSAPTPYARPPPRSTEEKWVHDAYQGDSGRRGDGPRGRGGRPGGSFDRFASAAANTFTGVSPRVEVSGLHYEVTPADLKGIFEQAGSLVQGPTIVYDRSGRSTGVATMEYSTVQEAKIAINKFDGAKTKGETISIKFLPPKNIKRSHGVPQAQRQQSGASLLSRLGGEKPAQNGGSGRQSDGGNRRGGRNGPQRGSQGDRGGPGASKPKRGPINQDDLDKELDGFMKSDAAGDVAMA